MPTSVLACTVQVDQHAADERVQLEELQRDCVIPTHGMGGPPHIKSVELTTPLEIFVSKSEALMLMQYVLHPAWCHIILALCRILGLSLSSLHALPPRLRADGHVALYCSDTATR